MGKSRCSQLAAERLVGAVGNQVAGEFALRRFHRRIGFTGGHAIAFGEQLEVMDEGLHRFLHLLTLRRRDLVVLHDHRTRIGPQPGHALLDDAIGLAHLLDAHEITVVTIAVDANRNVEIDFGIFRIRLLLAQIPGDARATQHRSAHAPGIGQLGRDNADVDGALLPDAVGGQQFLVLVDLVREIGAERLEVVEHRAFAPLVEALEVIALVPARFLVFRHHHRQIAIDAAGAIVGRVHACAGDCLIAIHQLFALAEGVEEHRHRAKIERVRADPHEVIEDARDLVEHRADPLRAFRNLELHQIFDGAHVGVLVAHHRDVVESIHVADRLVERLGFGKLLGAAMKQADMRIGPHDGLAIHFQDEAEDAMRSRMLRAEVHRVIADFFHQRLPPSDSARACS